MEIIVTFGLWAANNVWSNLMNGLRGDRYVTITTERQRTWLKLAHKGRLFLLEGHLR